MRPKAGPDEDGNDRPGDDLEEVDDDPLVVCEQTESEPREVKRKRPRRPRKPKGE